METRAASATSTASADAIDLKKEKAYYAFLGHYEKRVRQQIRNARKIGNTEKADRLWEKVQEIREMRRTCAYAQFVQGQAGGQTEAQNAEG